MTNNNKQNPDINSLKASFCRQHFPFLLQFLRHFDLSTKGSEHSLGMEFLLDSYNYSQGTDTNIQHRKNTCRWQLDNVSKEDVLLAIDEYFYITNQNDDLASQRNKLLINILRPNKFVNYKFDDLTTLSIIKRFNIIKEVDKGKNDKGNNKKKDWNIGRQKGSFSDFIACLSGINKGIINYDDTREYDSEVGKIIKEYSFVNAFHLLGSLRNRSGHEIVNYTKDELLLFYRYIIYTHIGIVYVCRRYWKKHGDDLVRKGYDRPDIIDTFHLEKDPITIVVKGIEEGQLVTNCECTINGDLQPISVKAAREISFKVDVEKFSPIEIKITCDGKDYNIERIIPYYGWNRLVIEIQPPARVHCHFEGIGGDDNKIETIISSLFSDFEEKYKKVGDDHLNKLASFWNKIEPLLHEQRSFMGKALSEQEVRLKDELQKSIHDLMNSSFGKKSDLMGGITCLDKKIKKTEEVLDAIDKSRERVEFVSFLKKHLLSVFLLMIAIGAFIVSYHNDLSLFFIQQSWWIIIAEIFIFIIASLSFWNIWESHKTTTRPDLLKPVFKATGWSLAGLTSFFFFLAFMLIPIKSPKELVQNYNFFTEHESGEIFRAAKIMKDYYNDHPDDEDVRIQLAKYYINYEGEHDKAYEVVKEMINEPEKYKKGVDIIAEIFYEKGDFAKVINIIEKNQKDKSPVIMRIEGLMNAYHFGAKQDLEKSLSLLECAASQGDAAAMYWLGHIYSNVVGKWVYSYKEGEKEEDYSVSDYDLVYAVENYKKAVMHNFPKAAIELGNLYFDLNMNNQANYYYKIALELTDKTLLNEARYRMGLLYEKLGIDDNEYMEAVETSYGPAILHAALRNDTTAQIYFDELEKRGGYKGYLYIPPIVIHYIRNHDTKNALECLNKYRPEGHFSEKFVEAMDDILSHDSIAQTRGRLSMISLAGECRYAQMLSVFWELRDIIRTPQQIQKQMSHILSQIKTLDKIGEDITFAYVLAAWILKDMGNEFFNQSNMYAQKAINRNHPAGGFILSYIPKHYNKVITNKMDNAYLSDDPYNEKIKTPWSNNTIKEIKEIRSIVELALRMSPDLLFKQNLINIGQKTDKLLSVFKLNENSFVPTSDFVDVSSCSNDVLDFWTDVAIANNDVTGECYMLYLFDTASKRDKNFGLEYRKKLLDSLLIDITLYPVPLDSFDYCFISKQIESMPNEFVLYLTKKFETSSLVTRIIENRKKYKKFLVTGHRVPNFNYSDWFYKWLGDSGLLDEFSTFTDKRYILGNGKIEVNNLSLN